MKINDRLKKLREGTKLSQEDFATSISLKRANYAQMELGKQNPTIETLTEIVRIYNKDYPHVTYDWLIEGKKPDKPPPKEAVKEQQLSERQTVYATKTIDQELAWRDKYIDLLERKIQELPTAFVPKETFEDVSTKVDALQELVLERLSLAPGTSYEEVSAQLHIKKDALKKLKKAHTRSGADTSHKE